ncbi:MAG: sulfotransferase [Halioglobus sp.]
MRTETRPNLFIVGAQKSGTSALAGWLSQHPQVLMSFPKEPGFLAFGSNGYTYPDGWGRPAPAKQYVVTDERAYLDLFSRASSQQHVIGEASTWYFALPGMAHKIHDFNPDAKIIVMLRNPVERAYSAWCHAKGDELEPCENFASALALETQRGEVEFLLRYRYMGLYSEALADYQAVFPAAKLLVLFHDDVRADVLPVWQQVCSFLNIDPAQVPNFAHRYNPSGQPRIRLLHKLLRSHRIRRFVRILVPRAVAIETKQRLDSINLQKYPPIDSESRAELQAYFHTDIQKVSQLTNRDLSSWLQ